MKKRSRKKHSKLLLPLIVFFLGSAGLLALCLLLIVRDTPTNPAVPNEIESALDTLEKKDESITPPIQQFEVPVQITREDSINHKPLPASIETDITKILNKHVEAMGGWLNWNQIESIRLSGTISKEGSDFPIVMLKKRPSSIRVTVEIPHPLGAENQLKVISALDGENGWSAVREGGEMGLNKRKISAEEAESLKDDASVIPNLMQFMQSGHTIELLDIEEETNPNYYIIATTAPKTEERSYLFHLSVDDFRVLKMSSRSNNNLVATYDHKRYNKIANVYVPTLVEMSSPGTPNSVINIENVTLGVGIHEEYFSIE